MPDLTNPSVVTPEVIERLEHLLEDLKNDARAAHDAKDVFMAGVYQQLLDQVSPILVKAHARLGRETRSTFRKSHTGLKKAAKAAKAGTTP